MSVSSEQTIINKSNGSVKVWQSYSSSQMYAIMEFLGTCPFETRPDFNVYRIKLCTYQVFSGILVLRSSCRSHALEVPEQTKIILDVTTNGYSVLSIAKCAKCKTIPGTTTYYYVTKYNHSGFEEGLTHIIPLLTEYNSCTDNDACQQLS